LPVYIPPPLSCRLRKQHSSERNFDEPSTGLVIVTTEEAIVLLNGSGQMDEAFRQHLQKLICSAATKFTDHVSSRRIVIIQPISASLYSAVLEFGSDILTLISIPPSIEEVWMSFHIEGNAWCFTRLSPSDA
jgi:hypothetical protein